MGPRSRGAHPAARTPALVDRLRRRLRSKGVRASYNLQMVGGRRRRRWGGWRGHGAARAVGWLAAACCACTKGPTRLGRAHPRSFRPPAPPQVPRADAPSPDASLLSVLHITPLRASRPLALRYLAQRLSLPLDAWVLLALAPEAAGQGGDLVAGAYCSDAPDLLGGCQRVRARGQGRGRAVEGVVEAAGACRDSRTAGRRASCELRPPSSPRQVCVAVPDASAAAALPSPPGLLARTLGVQLAPFLQGTDRVVVAPEGQAADTVLKVLAQAPSGEQEPAK